MACQVKFMVMSPLGGRFPESPLESAAAKGPSPPWLTWAWAGSCKVQSDSDLGGGQSGAHVIGHPLKNGGPYGGFCGQDLCKGSTEVRLRPGSRGRGPLSLLTWSLKVLPQAFLKIP